MRRTTPQLAQNLLQEVQAAVEAKPFLASSPFKQRRAFLSALRADMMARTGELARSNRHDYEAFTQQLQTAGTVSMAPPAAGGRSGAGTTPLSSPTPFARRGSGAPGASVSAFTGTGAAASGDMAARQHGEEQPAEHGAVAPRTGEFLGPFYQSAFTSRPSQRQHLFPLRLDKVFSVIDYLLDQPDPIALPSDCWLTRSGAGAGGGEDKDCPVGDDEASEASRRLEADPQVEVFKICVPLGVVGVLSRYRPRMLLDATAMGIFAGNALLLDGGASLHCTNSTLMHCVRRALLAVGLPTAAVVHVESYDPHSRLTMEWLHMADRVDMGLVCGPPKLYDFARRNSSIPLMRATSRSCSLFVHESASYDTALRVILNAKRQAPVAANSLTTLIVHSKFPRYVELLKDLVEENVTLLGDHPARSRAPECIHEIASDEEYRGLSQGLRDFSQTLCIKTVENVDQALFFLDLFGSKQTDGILASDEAAIAEFCKSADSAVVLVNASTRLSSGIPLGCGPDLAITTSKVHCRGPFTLSALTTRKFIVRAKREDGALRH